MKYWITDTAYYFYIHNQLLSSKEGCKSWIMDRRLQQTRGIQNKDHNPVVLTEHMDFGDVSWIEVPYSIQ
jgi:hypothetical protein